MDNRKILRRPKVLGKVQICCSTMYAMIAAGEFPAPIKLGPRSVGWIAQEIDDWLEDRIKERDSKLEGRSHAG